MPTVRMVLQSERRFTTINTSDSFFMSIENYKNKITEFYKSKRRMPTYVETMKLVGFKSKNAVFKLVNKLSDDGFLTKDKNGRLAPEKIYGELPGQDAH